MKSLAPTEGLFDMLTRYNTYVVFNDTTDKEGLIQHCEFILFGSEYGTISDNTNRLKTFTNLLNRGLDTALTKALQSDGRWQFDDSNYTTYPIGTADLVAGQTDYTLDYDTTGLLRITGVDVLDSDGKYQTLEAIDEHDFRSKEYANSEYLSDDGVPRYYDTKSNAVFLYPAPASGDVTLTDGLKVYFQREPSYFDSDDTTKTPGIPSIFHPLVAMYACYNYASANDMKKREVLKRDIQEMEADLMNFMNTRQNDDRNYIGVRQQSFR